MVLVEYRPSVGYKYHSRVFANVRDAKALLEMLAEKRYDVEVTSLSNGGKLLARKVG